jgi:hypothetical protein
MIINILNHKSRDIKSLTDRLDGLGIKNKVWTDYSDYYLTRDKNRYMGLNRNYFGTLGKSTEDWTFLMHDDLEFEDNVFEKVKYILKRAPEEMICFYNPDNKGFKKASSKGHHVLRSRANFWLQAVAYHRGFLDKMLSWIEENIDENNFGLESEDSIIDTFLFSQGLVGYSVIPALFQHEGFDKSTFKIPGSINGLKRRSGTYDPNVDYKGIDWEKEFKNSFYDSRFYNSARIIKQF